MQEPISTADLKLGFHRGSPRLWIEGKKLKAAGFSWGSKYRIEQTSDGLVISLADDGPDTVAGRTRNGQELPIIDRHESSWSQLFPSGRVSVQFFANRILVHDSRSISRDVESAKLDNLVSSRNSLPVSEATVSPVDSAANKFRDSSKSHARNQKWSREEIILALDVYMRFGLIGEQHPELQKLSNTLRDRKELSTVEVPSKYRNINGVKMKLANLASLDPGYEGVGLKSGGKLEEEIWNEFVGDQERLSIIASQLRSNPNKSSQFSHDNRSVRITDVEQVHTPEYSVIGSSDEKIASRREQKMVLAFRDYLSSKGHVVKQHVYGNGQSAMRCDLFDETSNVLYEAKGTSHRMNIRLAIGQLFDYRRFENKEPELAILVPGRPNDEIVDLCNSLNIEIVWPTGDSFISTNNAI